MRRIPHIPLGCVRRRCTQYAHHWSGSPFRGFWNAVAGIKLALCIVGRLTRADLPSPPQTTHWHLSRRPQMLWMEAVFGSTGTGCIALIVVRCRCCCSSSIDHGAELPSSSSSPAAVAIIDTAFHHTPNQKTTHTKQFAYSQVYIKCNKQTAKHSHLIMHIACPLRATGAHSAYYTNALVRCIYALQTSRHNARATSEHSAVLDERGRVGWEGPW